jgi:hypothetical protein
MDVQTLLTTLLQARGTDQSLAFTGSLVGSTDLAALLETYFPDGTVSIAGTTIDTSTDGTSVDVGGSVDYQQLAACQLAMTLTPTATDVFCAIVLTPSTGWGLAGPFPNVLDATMTALSFVGGGLVVASGQYTEPFQGLTVERGMTVVGALDMATTSGLGYLSLILPGVASLPLHGAVTDPDLPEIVLQTTPVSGTLAGTGLSGVSLVFTLGNASTTGDPPIAVATAELQASVDLGHGVGGSVKVDLTSAASTLTVAMTFENASLASGFDVLQPFIGAADPLSSLPTELLQAVKAAASTVVLRAVDVVLEPTTMTVQSADVAIAVELSRFGVFDALSALKVDELDLTWSVDPTTTPATVTFSAVAPVQVTPTCPVLVGFQTQPADGYVIFVREDTDAVLHLADLVTAFSPGLTLPELDVSDLAVTLSPRVSQYSFATTISGSWPAHDDLPDVAQVAVDVVYDAAATPALSGSIKGTLSLPVPTGAATAEPATIASGNGDGDGFDPPPRQIDLLLGASRPAGGDGWLLEGATGPGDVVPVGDLIDALVHNFGVDDSVPDVISTLTISDLGVSFDTSSDTFTFGCGLEIVVEGTPVDLLVNVTVTKGTTGYDKTFGGSILVGPFEFDLRFTSTATGSTSFVAVYTHAPSDPAEISLKDLVAAISPSAAADIPAGITIGLTDVKLVFVRDDGASEVAFGLDLALSLSLSDLPLVGSMVPADALRIDSLQIGYSSATLTADQAKDIDSQLPATVVPFPAGGLPAGVVVAADIVVAGEPQHVSLAIPAPSSSPPAPDPLALTASAAPTAISAADAAAASTTRWFDVQRTVGPISLARVGVSYQDGSLFFLLDAAVNLSALQLGLDGLGLGSPLSHFAPEGHLDGLAIGFQQGPVTISGAFLHVASPPPGVTDEYLGELTIAVEPYLISGVGAYAKVDGHPSFFVFAEVTGEFGGPPAFFITGFMGGVGYNWALNLPAPEQVYTFPFIAGLDDPNVFGANPSPIDVLNALSGAGGKPAWVSPALGENWIAGGLRFTSFELVLGKALVVAAFGKDFEIALLGLATISLPQGAPPEETYAYVELQFEVVLKPDDGIFSATASLTPNSYLLTRQCHLTGGFAFFLWFGSNPHAGDFVVTLGGYHPAFTPPAWYPRVAPLGFNWQVSDKVLIKGGVYFALTPTAAMAGGTLQVQFDDGDLKAWVSAYANVMVRWRPLYVTADIGISVGVKYRMSLGFTTVTLSVELGATLSLWGPPTGGVAHIDWSIISFSIGFGAGKRSAGDLTLDWSGVEALLPNAPAATTTPAAAAVAATPAAASTTPIVLTLSVNDGLLRTDSTTDDWIVRADQLALTSASTVPMTSITFGTVTVDLPSGAATTIDIRPMGVTGATSTHSISIISVDDPTTPLNFAQWSTSVQTASLPEAIWGTPLADSAAPAPTANLVTGLATNLYFRPPRSAPGATLGPVDPASLITPLGGGYLPLDPSHQVDPIAPPTPDANSIVTVIADVASQTTTQVQQQLVAALAGYAAAPPTSAPLTRFGEQAGTQFAQPPMLAGAAPSRLDNGAHP